MNLTVIGTGYVGLVTGACLAELGNQVFCLDIDLQNRSETPICEPGPKEVVERNVEAGRLNFSTDIPASVAHGSVQCIAATRAWRRSPWPKTRCSPARWSLPTSPMPLPRSPASRCARAATGNTGKQRHGLQQRDADEFVWAGGLLSRGEQPRAARRAYSPLRSQAAQPPQPRNLGHRYAETRVSLLGRHGYRERALL
jgi:hypothetical protein